jgi:dihydroxyacetone kinase-like protein
VARTIGVAEFKTMLQGAVLAIGDNYGLLTRLDSACGDGDHGSTMLRAAQEIGTLVQQNTFGSVSSLLQRTGVVLLTLDGGASSPLLGKFFLGMARACGELVDLDCAAIAFIFAAGRDEFKSWTKAQLGDKTMLDALEPAVAALLEYATPGQDPYRALEAAAHSARQGALATKELKAHFGRAQYLGDRTVGWQDPGATTIALIFEGFLQGLQTCWEA